MIKAPRFSRRAGGERRADRIVAEHRLLDERGSFLGSIDEATEPPVFGPLEPTVYLHRDLARPDKGTARSDPKASPSGTSAHSEEDVKR